MQNYGYEVTTKIVLGITTGWEIVLKKWSIREVKNHCETGPQEKRFPISMNPKHLLGKPNGNGLIG